MAKSKLEELSDIYRVQNLIKNDYQKVEGSSYSVTHKNAISDGNEYTVPDTSENADQFRSL